MPFQKLLLSPIFLCLLLFSNHLIAAEKPVLSFGVVADIQYCDHRPYQSRYFQNSISKLEPCVQVFNSRDLKFVINLGDIIDREFTNYDSILPVFDKIKAPKYHVLGNHEFSISDRLKASIPEKLALKNSYYDFKIKSWRFVVLDGKNINLHRYSASDSHYAKANDLFNRLKKNKTENIQAWSGAIGEV